MTQVDGMASGVLEMCPVQQTEAFRADRPEEATQNTSKNQLAKWTLRHVIGRGEIQKMVYWRMLLGVSWKRVKFRPMGDKVFIISSGSFNR